MCDRADEAQRFGHGAFAFVVSLLVPRFCEPVRILQYVIDVLTLSFLMQEAMRSEDEMALQKTYDSLIIPPVCETPDSICLLAQLVPNKWNG